MRCSALCMEIASESGVRARLFPREVDADRKKIEDLLRERDILNKNVIKTDEKTKKQIDLVKRQETQQHNLLKDIQRWKADAVEMKKRIYELEQQREKYGIELSQANAKSPRAEPEPLHTRSSMFYRLVTGQPEIAPPSAVGPSPFWKPK